MYKQYKPYQYFLIFTDFFLVGTLLILMVKLRPFLPGKTVLPTEVILDFRGSWPMFLTVPVLYHAVFAMTGVYDLSRVLFFRNRLRV